MSNTPMTTSNTRSSATVAIILNGALGRMGSRIAACAEGDASVRIAARLDRGDIAEALQQPSVPSTLASGNVIIDFTSDAGAADAALLAAKLRVPLLVGTTALAPNTERALEDLARQVPVMVCSNTSLGVAVARRLAREAARLLGAAYDVDIIETHHTKKLDAPSGTALALAASVVEGGREISRDRVHAIRAGDVIGDHIVQFAGAGEILQIRHTATTRDLFARGAIRAGAWLVGKPAGRYRIEDTFPA
ncbi:MAG: 4-hydroxy-tetrahydrodipicolinate reductase [Phycisphaerae bacterium]|nr:4-hydroxy-tetrahydrodipicolinate reductase [Phycisphaerae bacterium]